MILSLEAMLQLSIVLPLLATVGIVAAGRQPNLREAVTIGTSLVVFYFVVNLYQGLKQVEVISVQWWQLVPGLQLSFAIEPLGMLFALVASFLWIITTIYSIGYMRSHHEQNQTRFFAAFAVSIAATMGIAFSANLFTLFLFYELLTLATYPLVSHAGTPEDDNIAGLGLMHKRLQLGQLVPGEYGIFLELLISIRFH